MRDSHRDRSLNQKRGCVYRHVKKLISSKVNPVNPVKLFLGTVMPLMIKCKEFQ